MIEPGQDPIDMIHVTDLFTTAARVAGVTDKIPTDRIIDGVDQTALLLLGEGHSRRDYMFHYSGPEIGAVRMGKFKMHVGPEKGGVPEAEVYNMQRDPREEHPSKGDLLAYLIPFQRMIQSHLDMKKKFPDRVLKPAAGQ